MREFILSDWYYTYSFGYVMGSLITYLIMKNKAKENEKV